MIRYQGKVSKFMTTPGQSHSELLAELDTMRRRVADLETSMTGRPLFETVFRANPDAIAVVRLHDGLCIEVNDRFLQISGYSYEEVVGRTDTAQNLEPANDLPSARRLFDAYDPIQR